MDSLPGCAGSLIHPEWLVRGGLVLDSFLVKPIDRIRAQGERSMVGRTGSKLVNAERIGIGIALGGGVCAVTPTQS